jgi:hypothetical protein
MGTLIKQRNSFLRRIAKQNDPLAGYAKTNWLGVTER